MSDKQEKDFSSGHPQVIPYGTAEKDTFGDIKHWFKDLFCKIRDFLY